MKIYLAGNYPQARDREASVCKIILSRPDNYHYLRLISFYHMDEYRPVLTLREKLDSEDISRKPRD